MDTTNPLLKTLAEMAHESAPQQIGLILAELIVQEISEGRLGGDIRAVIESRKVLGHTQYSIRALYKIENRTIWDKVLAREYRRGEPIVELKDDGSCISILGNDPQLLLVCKHITEEAGRATEGRVGPAFCFGFSYGQS